MSKDGLEQFHQNDAYFAKRIIELSGDVDLDMYTSFAKNISVMDSYAGDITIILNSNGGDTTHGLAIYDLIKGCVNKITIIVYGEACSSASFILQAADHRVMAPHSIMMIHVGTENHPEDHPKIIEAWFRHNQRVETQMEDIYLSRIKLIKPKYTRNQLKSMLIFDKILLPKEALAIGLIDEISTLQNIKGYSK